MPKMTVDLHADVLSALTKLAAEDDVSVTEYLRRTISAQWHVRPARERAWYEPATVWGRIVKVLMVVSITLPGAWSAPDVESRRRLHRASVVMSALLSAWAWVGIAGLVAWLAA